MGFLINPHRFGSGPSAPSAQRWRIYITKINDATDFCRIGYLQMRQGSTNLSTGGTASASSEFSGYTAAEGFNNLLTSNNYWASSTVNVPEWLEYDFGSAVTIDNLLFQAPTHIETGMPRDFALEYYNGSSWVEYWSTTDFCSDISASISGDNWRKGEVRGVIVDGSGVAGQSRSWRVLISALDTGTRPRIGEAEWKVSSSEVSQTGTSTNTFAMDAFTGFQPEDAFNNLLSSNNHWAANSTSSAGWHSHWMGDNSYQACDELVMIAPSQSGTAGDMPEDFNIQYRDENTGNWVTASSVTGETGWTLSESRNWTW